MREASSARYDDDTLTVHSNDGWSSDLTPDPDATQLKWGLNGETGEVTAWEVAGPGDGFPSHNAYLTTAWGRAPRVEDGDIVGVAEWRPPTLAIHTYARHLPELVEAHFRAAYPDARIVRS